MRTSLAPWALALVALGSIPRLVHSSCCFSFTSQSAPSSDGSPNAQPFTLDLTVSYTQSTDKPYNATIHFPSSYKVATIPDPCHAHSSYGLTCTSSNSGPLQLTFSDLVLPSGSKGSPSVHHVSVHGQKCSVATSCAASDPSPAPAESDAAKPIMEHENITAPEVTTVSPVASPAAIVGMVAGVACIVGIVVGLVLLRRNKAARQDALRRRSDMGMDHGYSGGRDDYDHSDSYEKSMHHEAVPDFDLGIVIVKKQQQQHLPLPSWPSQTTLVHASRQQARLPQPQESTLDQAPTLTPDLGMTLIDIPSPKLFEEEEPTQVDYFRGEDGLVEVVQEKEEKVDDASSDASDATLVTSEPAPLVQPEAAELSRTKSSRYPWASAAETTARLQRAASAASALSKKSLLKQTRPGSTYGTSRMQRYNSLHSSSTVSLTPSNDSLTDVDLDESVTPQRAVLYGRETPLHRAVVVGHRFPQERVIQAKPSIVMKTEPIVFRPPKSKHRTLSREVSLRTKNRLDSQLAAPQRSLSRRDQSALNAQEHRTNRVVLQIKEEEEQGQHPRPPSSLYGYL